MHRERRDANIVRKPQLGIQRTRGSDMTKDAIIKAAETALKARARREHEVVFPVEEFQEAVKDGTDAEKVKAAIEMLNTFARVEEEFDQRMQSVSTILTEAVLGDDPVILGISPDGKIVNTDDEDALADAPEEVREALEQFKEMRETAKAEAAEASDEDTTPVGEATIEGIDLDSVFDKETGEAIRDFDGNVS